MRVWDLPKEWVGLWNPGLLMPQPGPPPPYFSHQSLSKNNTLCLYSILRALKHLSYVLSLKVLVKGPLCRGLRGQVVGEEV